MSIWDSTFRLIFIAIASLIVVGGGLFTLRQVGMTQVPPPLEHPLMKGPFWLMARGDTDSAPLFSAQSYTAALELDKSIILAVDVRPSKDQQWMVFGRYALESYTNGKGALEALTAAEISKLFLKDKNGNVTDQKIMRFEDFLRNFPSERLAVIVHTAEISGVKSFLQTMQSRSGKPQTLISSPNQSTLRVLRKEQPEWLFGSDPSTWTRLSLMSALFLEPLADMWPDYMITPLRTAGVFNLKPRLVAEFRRRHKPLVIEADGDEALSDDLVQEIRGVLTKRPRWALKLRSH